ncbi:MAG: MerR family DNA-binding transcriptional regulator [Thermodesulfobacteriota bacterium]|nr:MerR family DNA-binding transcriptional regulator [Thermodesulfobacteriota bacterium]
MYIEKQKSKECWTISELAGQLDISTRTIRFYEEKGLISPERTPGNQRIYTSRNRARLKLILRGKRFGFSLDEISEMIGMANADMDEMEQIKKSFAFASTKLKEIKLRRVELDLLEQEILSTMDKLKKRMEKLKKQEDSP